MRLRNSSTGAVVSCSEETAAALGSEWVDAEEHIVEPEPETPKAPEPQAPPAPPAPVPAPPKK